MTIISSRSLCLHRNFKSDVRVAILEDTGKFSAECAIACADCGEQFRWYGVPAGFSLHRPMTSLDGLELRAPIEPRGDAPILAMRAQYTMPEKKVDVAIIKETIVLIREAAEAARYGKLFGVELDQWANTLERAIGETKPS